MAETKTWVKFEKKDDFYGTFTMAPLEHGMGLTIGNSLRRVLLSSLQGVAISSLIIEGVEHEFSSVPHMVEDVLDVICNLKKIVFKSHTEEPKKLSIDFNEKGNVIAKDIKHDTDVEIVNPDQHIAEFSKKSKFKVEMVLERGYGYVPSESSRKEDQTINTINMDCSFSPVIRVNPTVEKIRVGRSLDYDSVKLEVWTNGSLDAEAAIKEATGILMGHFALFGEMNNKPIGVSEQTEPDPEEKKKTSALSLTVEDLELSARSLNCLKKAGIETVEELTQKSLNDLIQIKNFGKKSAEEINDKLKQYNLSLKED